MSTHDCMFELIVELLRLGIKMTRESGGLSDEEERLLATIEQSAVEAVRLLGPINGLIRQAPGQC